jgi:hypothetical protein
MFLGDMTTQSGFLPSAFSFQLLALYTAAWTYQILRIFVEEKLLMRDARCQDFCRIVRYQLIPKLV